MKTHDIKNNVLSYQYDDRNEYIAHRIDMINAGYAYTVRSIDYSGAYLVEYMRKVEKMMERVQVKFKILSTGQVVDNMVVNVPDGLHTDQALHDFLQSNLNQSFGRVRICRWIAYERNQ